MTTPANPPTPKATDQKVSEKSTKTELWSAYNELLRQLEGRAAEPASPKTQATLSSDPTRSLAELKLKIGQQLDALAQEITNDLGNLQNIRRQIQVERSQLLEARQAEQRQLADAITEVKRQWQQEQDQHTQRQIELKQEQDRQRQREDEDFRYNLAKTRRTEEDKYQEQRTAREAVLANREQTFAEREQNLKHMETELAAWPKRLDDAVAQATSTLRKDLEAKQATDAREQKLVHQHELAMVGLKAQTLEQTVKAQAAEIDSLKRALADAQHELKNMAVAVIEARTTENRPQPQPATPAAQPSKA
ncbi:MAG TPA: hypothetical protein VI322_03690 [Candidatus Saccharimonadia bacterium]